MTIMEELTAQGLGSLILGVDETAGSVEWAHGVHITAAQMRLCSDIVMQHTDPAGYADMMAFRAEVENLRANYSAFDTWLEDCISRPNPTPADIHHVAQILQSIMGMNVSQIPGHPTHPAHPPHGTSAQHL